MVADDREIDNWRDEIRQRLVALHKSISSPELVSDVPIYIIERLATNVEELVSSDIDAESVRTLLLGAYRTICDVVNPDDSDAVMKRLHGIEDLLPPQ